MFQRDAFEDPHLRARGMFQRRFQEDTGEVDWIGPYIRTEEGPLPIRRPPVRLAEDNEYVYKEILGVSDDEFERYRADKHVADAYLDRNGEPY